MYGTMCMTQNMGAIFLENQGVWYNMYDTKKATIICHLYELFSLMNQAYESFLPPALLDSCLGYHPNMGD